MTATVTTTTTTTQQQSKSDDDEMVIVGAVALGQREEGRCAASLLFCYIILVPTVGTGYST